jgi:hypothetical protein
MRMRLVVLILIALSAGPVVIQGAVIQGVVLEEETGNPLARTVVSLIPLPGTQAGSASVRAGDHGAFTLNNIAAGWYVLRCSRKGFVPAEVGQLRPGRPGMPFEITAGAQSSFFQIRMKRMGAVTGSVLDENGVGIPDWPVHIFTARKPVRRIGESKTDDRGNFRIGELDAGSYLVRSGAGSLEDDSYLLPTWYKYGTAVESAEPAKVRVAETASDIVIRPVKGRMVQLSGVFTSQTPAVLTLITDTGRKVLASSGNTPAAFDASVAPGPVAFVAEGNGAPCGAYVRMLADHNMQGIRVACSPLEPSFVLWSPGVRTQFPLMMRRVDLDGTSQPRAYRSREAILPGHWEFRALTSADYYVKSIASQINGHGETVGDGWFGIDIGTGVQIAVALSNKPASISGVVATAGQPVAGAAVYLEIYDPEAVNPRLQLFEARSDAQGAYRFTGLAPGRYRVLSSFDFDPEDRLAMEKAQLISLKEGDSAVQALELVLP